MKTTQKLRTRKAPKTNVSEPVQKMFIIFRIQLLTGCKTFSLVLLTDVRKRHKKDHNKSWKHEERRSSGEHRRSSGQQAARRASAGRRRDWNSDESSEGSPPPSFNDGTAFILCILPVDLACL